MDLLQLQVLNPNNPVEDPCELFLTAVCLSHYIQSKNGFFFSLLPCSFPPNRMFLTAKKYLLVILAPLGACGDQFSLLFMMVLELGHRSLTFSKRSIHLSVHPATYLLMFSYCFWVSGACWRYRLVFIKPLSLSVCAIICPGPKAGPKSAGEENDGSLLRICTWDRGKHIVWVVMVGYREEQGQAESKLHITLPSEGHPIPPNLSPSSPQ